VDPKRDDLQTVYQSFGPACYIDSSLSVTAHFVRKCGPALPGPAVPQHAFQLDCAREGCCRSAGAAWPTVRIDSALSCGCCLCPPSFARIRTVCAWIGRGTRALHARRQRHGTTARRYEDDFAAGVLANANAGGENCHRGAAIGAVLGAQARAEYQSG
jgi:ADP-ribosylglycohydrolase